MADTNIAIIGTGPTGLIMALALARETNFQIHLFGPPVSQKQQQKDTRTTAFMAPSLIMLENLGLWSELAASAAPLTHLRLIDDLGGLFRAPDCLFTADEIALEAFAQNIPNKDLLSLLVKKINDASNIEWHQTSAVKDIETHKTHLTIITEEGATFKTPFLIGADGRNSICREKSGIKTTPWHYQQTAIACAFTHERPHNATSIELHRPTGPLTLIPLKEHHASLVWSLTPQEAARISALPDEAFCAELYQASHAIWGTIKTAGHRVAFPISGMKVDKFAANRIALVGEAAHVVPPIGAQGLNLGLRDIAYLTACLNGAPDLTDPTTKLEDAYNLARKSDVWSRTTAIDWLNKSLLLSYLPLSAARITGLNLLNLSKTLRQSLITAGLKGAGPLPPLMEAANLKTA